MEERQERFGAACEKMQSKIDRLHHEPARVLLSKMVEASQLTLRTNFFSIERYALSLRVHPKLMVPEGSDKPMPYGVFFVNGRTFNAFHCRFKDIARGGKQ
jgi:glutamate dehydrogenase